MNETTADGIDNTNDALLAVWWLEEKDYHGFEPHQEQNPLKIPDYIWEQFCSRCGRAGRGRLWVPDHIEIDRLPVSNDDPNWPSYENAGGIVIEAKDAAACLLWGGRVTTLSLEEFAANAQGRRPYDTETASRWVWWIAELAMKQPHPRPTAKVGDIVVEVTHLIGLAHHQLGRHKAIGELLEIEEGGKYGTRYLIKSADPNEGETWWENCRIEVIEQSPM